MLCRAKIDIDTVSLQERNGVGVYDEHMSVSFLGAEWKGLRTAEHMVSVELYSAPVASCATASASCISLLHDWRDHLKEAILLYPLPAGGSIKRDKAVGRSSASDALRLLFAPQRRRRRMPCALGVKAVLPKAAKASDNKAAAEHSETELGDSSCNESLQISSSSGSDDCGMVDAALQKGGHRNYRGENDLTLNGHHYTRLYSVNRWTGVKSLSGYCIWCSARHLDTERPHLECKKDLHMGSDLSEDTVLRRLQCWEEQRHRFDGEGNPRRSHLFCPSSKRIRQRTPSP